MEKWLQVIATLNVSGHFTFDQARLVGVIINGVANGQTIAHIRERVGEQAWKELSAFADR